MRTRKLKPEQIIVPGEYYLENESILKIYFRIFERGHGNDLPPVVVTSPVHFDYFQRLNANLKKDIQSLSDWPKRNPFVTLGDIANAIERLRTNCQIEKEKYFPIIDRLKVYSENQGSIYLLLDGNHRTTAATLNHKLISALEVQTDEDLKEIRKMVERGALFDFKRGEKSLSELVNAFYEFCGSRIEETNSVKERIEELVSNGKDFPQYMKDKYLGVSN
ncbi:hypothetical protein J4429_06040 [Candidatus Pacearchaeota archaeon]|nr:hypothetical protein [Candidatus Pacearchaeota archaeon]